MDIRLAGSMDQMNIRDMGKVDKPRMDPVKEFNDLLKENLSKVNEMDKESRVQLEALASGRANNVHDVMIALEKSKIALEYTSAVRNKVLEAYKEIMRTQL